MMKGEDFLHKSRMLGMFIMTKFVSAAFGWVVINGNVVALCLKCVTPRDLRLDLRCHFWHNDPNQAIHYSRIDPFLLVTPSERIYEQTRAVWGITPVASYWSNPARQTPPRPAPPRPATPRHRHPPNGEGWL